MTQDTPTGNGDPSGIGAPSSSAARAKPPRRKGRKRRIGLATLLIMIAIPLGIAALMLRPQGVALPDIARERVAAGLSASLPPGGRIRLGETRLRFSANGRPVVTMDEVRLLDGEGRLIAQVPRVVTVLHRQGMLTGRVQPAALSLNGLTISVARTPQGAFLLSFGDGSTLPTITGLGDLVALLNDTMSQPRLAALDRFSFTDLTLQVSDPQAGRAFGLTNGAFDLSRTRDGLDVQLIVALRDPEDSTDALDPRLEQQSNATRIKAGLQTTFGTRATVMDLNIQGLPPALVAAQNPALAGLNGIDAPFSTSFRGKLNDTGAVSELSGTVELGEGTFTFAGEDAPLERLKAYLRLDPASKSFVLESFEMRSDPVSFDMTGQLGLSQDAALLAQLQMANLALDLPKTLAMAPEGPVGIDTIQADLRFDPTALRFDLGQVTARIGDATGLLNGDITFGPDGASLALDGALQQVGFDQALALWPPALIKGTRGWLAGNLANADVSRLDFSVRHSPGTRPNVALSAHYSDGRLSFLPDMPDLTGASGFFSLTGTRFALGIDRGVILANSAALSAAGTSFWVDDTTVKPAQAHVDLQISGPLRGALALMSRDPVNMPLQQLPITGQAQFAADISFPLSKQRRPEDVVWTGQGTLNRVVGDGLLEGRQLRASRLRVEASQQAVSVSGGVRVQGVPAQISLTRAIGNEVAPGVEVMGTLDLTQDALAKFGVSLGALEVAGRAPASFTLQITPNSAPRLLLVSDLQGASVAIPALGWRKNSETPADLALDLALDSPVQVNAISLSGAGLKATGTVQLNADNSLDKAVFDRVALDGWLDVSAEFTGRGAGRPAALALTGGKLDLRGFSNRGAGQTSGSGPRGPITVALRVLQVANDITVTNLRGTIAEGTALDGSFTGKINGLTPINAVLISNQGRTGLRVQAQNAGDALAALGVLQNGRGGALDLVLQSRSGGAVSNAWDGQLSIDNLVVENAPALAGLLSAVSVVGILEQMSNGGLSFYETKTDLTISPDGIALRGGRANGPSMGITFEGLVSPARGYMDLQGVISPLNIFNGIGGALFARRGEGLFGFSYRMAGAVKTPQVQVNPLSILTPGVFRDIFRREPPELE